MRAQRPQPDAPHRDDGHRAPRRARRAGRRRHAGAQARLELVGLPREVLQRYPIELSGGMKQRVVMVLSSILDPSLLIADEVTSALDVSSQRAVAELLVEFRNRGFREEHRRDHATSRCSTRSPARSSSCTPASWRRRRRRRRSSMRSVGCASCRPCPRWRPLRGEATQRHSGASALAARSPTGCRFRARCPLAFAKSPRPATAGSGVAARGGLLEGGGLMLRSTPPSRTASALSAARAPRRPERELCRRAGRGRVAHRRERERQVDDRQDDPPPARVSRGSITFDGADISR